ncbi:MAG: response regulator transcription factor [Cyanobacteria bacterium SZAS TMP-1]|nr:response regulator transcription factor [Cyanobacteria bacterium SZAS TMP-1]
MAKILLVEDDVALAEVTKFGLESQGHIVQVTPDGNQALDNLRINKYDLVVLDWMMPVVTGIEVLQAYRKTGGKTPVLMLTAKARLDDKEEGLDAGADDYLTKPFEHRELQARIRALLRRPTSLANMILTVDDITLDPATCVVTRAGKEIKLRPKVYSLLEFLMRHPNQVFSAEAILERVWLDDAMVSTDTVRAHFKLLRKSLGLTEDTIIRTVRNRGYMLVTDKDS